MDKLHIRSTWQWLLAIFTLASLVETIFFLQPDAGLRAIVPDSRCPLPRCPVNFGFVIGPAIGTRIAQAGLFGIFPGAAIFTALGFVALVIAHRQKVQE